MGGADRSAAGQAALTDAWKTTMSLIDKVWFIALVVFFLIPHMLIEKILEKVLRLPNWPSSAPKEVVAGVWIIRGWHWRFLPISANMVVVRLKSDGKDDNQIGKDKENVRLAIYGSLALTERLKAQIDKLGKVELLLCAGPNHDTHTKDWVDAYSSAKLLCAEDHIKEIAGPLGVTVAGSFEQLLSREFEDQASVVVHNFAPFLRGTEVVLELPVCQGGSVLLSCDLLQHSRPFRDGLVVTLPFGWGAWNGCPRLAAFYSTAFVRDRAGLRRKLKELATEDFGNVRAFVPLHGSPITENVTEKILKTAEVYLSN